MVTFSMYRSAESADTAGRNDGAGIRTRRETGDLMFDVALGRVAGRREQGMVIVVREVRPQHRHGRQRHRAFGEQVQNDRELPRRPRSFDAMVCRML